MLSTEIIIEKLQTIYDPEIPVNIYDLGLIYEIKSDVSAVHIIMTLTTASCPAAAFMPEEVKAVLLELNEVSNVTVELVFDPKWTRDRMLPQAKLQLGLA